MGTSDRIARFILDALESADGTAELQRSSLADRFGCVPSQINYVIATRFSPERGYMVESRRGGGGYIRITRVQPDASQFIMHTVNAVGRELDKPTADALLHNAVNAGALEVPFARADRRGGQRAGAPRRSGRDPEDGALIHIQTNAAHHSIRRIF